jgi:hypothetical protein
LEQSDVFTGPQFLLNRLETALNGAALRIAGKLFRAAPRDQVVQNRIIDDVGERFIRNLSDPELDVLEAELTQMGRSQGAGSKTKTRKARALAVEVLSVESEPLAEW